MVIRWIKELVTGRPSPVTTTNTAPTVVPIAAPAPKTIYPPNDQGIELQPVIDLVGSNSDLIVRLRTHAATTPERFDERYLQPIHRLAEFINTLPATSTSMFSGEAGLLRAAMELSFQTFQASDGKIFSSTETVERRHKLEPRWRYVCFCAGLLYPIGKSLGRITVSSRKGLVWQRHHSSLTDWAIKNQIDRMYVAWADNVSNDQEEPIGPSPYTASLLHVILGPENLAWLEEGSPDLHRVLLEIVSGHESSPNIAKDVIVGMWDRVLKREKSRRPQTYGRLTVGSHLAPYMLGAMRNLIDTGGWKPNELPVVVDATGIYLVWPQAGEDLIRQGVEEGHDGWPSVPSVVAQLLKSAGVFDTIRGNDMGMVEVIDSSGEYHSSFKLKDPNALLENYVASDYAKQSPKTLEAVLKKDPLSAAEGVVPPPAVVRTAKSAVQPAVQEAIPDQAPVKESESPQQEAPSDLGAAVERSTSDIASASTPAAPANQVSKQEPQKAKKTKTVEPLPPPVKGKVNEPDQVSFLDLVPDEVRKDMKTRLGSELLGKVIKQWRERPESNNYMRMTDNGAAINYEYLSQMMREPLNFITEMAEAGMIYTPPATPGLKISKIAIPENSSPREAIIISRFGCKRLGL